MLSNNIIIAYKYLTYIRYSEKSYLLLFKIYSSHLLSLIFYSLVSYGAYHLWLVGGVQYYLKISK